MAAINPFLYSSASSILEQIQRAERECTQLIQAAEKHAEDQIRAAHQKAAQMENDTPEGHHKTNIHKHQDVLVVAEQEAHEMIERAKIEASELTQTSDTMVSHMATWALEIVTGKGVERDA